MKQIIIARKDLNMSPGKLAAQVSHASMAFLTTMIQKKARETLCYPIKQHLSFDPEHPYKQAFYKRADLTQWAKEAFERNKGFFYTRPKDETDRYGELELCEPEYEYTAELFFEKDLYEGWIRGLFTKVVCEAKNENQLLRAARIAESMGLKEGKDFFPIRDACLTELVPENVDENGRGWTLTCIGFRPLEDKIAEKISKKFQLYK